MRVYGGINQTGDVWKQEGDWTGVLRTSGSVFNNGKPFPGADHVQLYWTYSGNNWTQCLHYNPGPGHIQDQLRGLDRHHKDPMARRMLRPRV
ncbi:hypothetical protein [Actinomadura sp. B10D3]|uniref:hypothetical protein n=1 Tax=Actinomadura sp. B10D3 TaxID=3153557 RepID=UPI00325DF793